MSGPDSISVSPDFLEFTSFASDIDLTTQSNVKREARVIRIVDPGSGSLVVVMSANDGVPNTRTATALVAGEELFGQFKTIKSSGTNVSKVRVYW